eukprot:TRINITY_DN3684_c0_g1_i1.p1 TRINITY_DN3684_c0_g1~~TRINITY_DN3684_c0_g1_i1.p1  ORF type:complete len:371 (-),score=181.45 TRINITY_DN3684_c0_g1_i1:62-1102(-)
MSDAAVATAPISAEQNLDQVVEQSADHAPVTADAQEALNKFIEQNEFVKRLADYPLVKTVCTSTSDMYTKAKGMSPAAVTDALARAEASVVEAIQKPMDLSTFNEFGLRQLDNIDHALETPAGKSFQNLPALISQTSQNVAEKTRSIVANPESLAPAALTQAYNDIKEKGVSTAAMEYSTSFAQAAVTKSENALAISDRSIEGETEAAPQLADRAINVTATAVYRGSRALDQLSRDKLAPETRERVIESANKIKREVIAFFYLILAALMSIPFFRDNQEKFNEKTTEISQRVLPFVDSFNAALVKVGQSEGTVTVEEAKRELVETAEEVEEAAEEAQEQAHTEEKI